MEFAVKTAPYLNVKYTNHIVSVENQPPLEPNVTKCESLMNRHNLELYHFYLNETDLTIDSYFYWMEKMMTVEEIRRYGIKVPNPLIGSPMRHIFAAYPGTGSIYALIARNDKNDLYSSSYVPAFTYACDPRSPDNNCDLLSTVFTKILCAILFFIGLVLCFAGHSNFNFEMFLIGASIGGLTSYILLLNNVSNTEYSLLIGIFSGMFWLFLRTCLPPVISTLPIKLIIGALLASTMMHIYLGQWTVLESDINFWSVYCCILLTIAVLLVCFGHVGNMVACAILGAFCIILSVDHFNGSSVGYIFINTIRRILLSNDEINNFRMAILNPPIQYSDTILLVCWLCFAALGFCIQFFSNLRRPPYPPPFSSDSLVSISLVPLSCCSCFSKRRNFSIFNVRTPLLRSNDDVFYSPTVRVTYGTR